MSAWSLHDRLVAARRARGLTQAGLAELSGLPQPQISKLEKGHIADPSLSSMIALSDALGVSIPLLTHPDQTMFLTAITALDATVEAVEAVPGPQSWSWAPDDVAGRLARWRDEGRSTLWLGTSEHVDGPLAEFAGPLDDRPWGERALLGGSHHRVALTERNIAGEVTLIRAGHRSHQRMQRTDPDVALADARAWMASGVGDVARGDRLLGQGWSRWLLLGDDGLVGCYQLLSDHDGQPVLREVWGDGRWASELRDGRPPDA